MRTRSQSRNSNRQQQQVNPTFVEPFNLVEPIENQAPPVVTMDDNRTMAQLLEAPTKGYEDAIVVPEITADNFELKHDHFYDEVPERPEYVGEETCGTKVCEDQKQNMEDTMLDLLEICRQKELYCIHNNVEDLIESALNSKLLLINLNSQRLNKEEQEVKNIAEPAAKRQTRITSCLQNFKVISKESTIPLNKTPQISPVNAITHDLPTDEPEDSLIMGNEELSTILEKESDEFIKSSVEDLIPIPRESEDTSGNDMITRFTIRDKDVLEDVKIYSNPLFEFDDEYISSDVNPLFDEVLENIESKDSYVSNLDEPALLVTPLSDANEDECFDPRGVINEIDAFLDMDISTDIENGYHDSEGDIIYLESLLIDDTSPNLPPEVYLDHDPRSLKDEPDNDDLMTEDKVFDPGSEDTIFDPDIPLSFFYFIKARWAYENPIVIFPFLFCPKDKGIRGEIIVGESVSFYGLEFEPAGGLISPPPRQQLTWLPRRQRWPSFDPTVDWRSTVVDRWLTGGPAVVDRWSRWRLQGTVHQRGQYEVQNSEGQYEVQNSEGLV
ncbi:hypothetical protein Tco_1218368 [Tanacetum coccineum]